ncbi:hypothetical protein IQ243_09320 [Nostocales cyanobacterium LEGE 11386]|nr:hypothetical protein [Nostocales cyanobacterium LEGE 11386]
MTGISLGDLVRLFNEVFPILPGSPLGEPEQSLRQFYAEEIGVIQVVRNPLPLWAQGDILEPIPFVDWSEEGKPVFFEAPGMIMNSTCDLDRKENIVLCPCLILTDLKQLSAYKDIPKNTVFDFLFLGKCLTGDEWVVDLSHPMTLPRHRIEKRIEEGSVSRKHSLTDKGWYLFITKFAIKYLRSDDFETMSQR